jgi:hypothetical protein
MLPDVDVREVVCLARAMTWKFAACRLPYAGAKAGLRFAGGDRAALLAAYIRTLEPYHDIFLTGPDMGTFPADFLDGTRTRCRCGRRVTRDSEWTTSPPGTVSRRPPRRRSPISAAPSRAQPSRSRASAEWAPGRRARALGRVRTGSTSRSSSRSVSVTLTGSSSTARARCSHGEALVELDYDVPGARPDSITPHVARRIRWSR